MTFRKGSPETIEKRIAVVFSALLPGVGHFYSGHVLLGSLAYGFYVLAVVTLAHFALIEFQGLKATLLILLVLHATAAGHTMRLTLRPMPFTAIPRYRQALLMLVAAMVILIFAVKAGSRVRAFMIPESKSHPTWMLGDHFFVDELAYASRQPERGEFIVFRHPQDRTRYFIKRVIGIPGDKIEIRSNAVFLNGKNLTEGSVPISECQIEQIDEPEFYKGGGCFQEKLNGKHYRVIRGHPPSGGDSYGPRIVPSNHYFLLGDNRDVSNDSRYWGFLDKDDITGKSLYIYLNLWIDPSSRHTSFKPKRIGLAP